MVRSDPTYDETCAFMLRAVDHQTPQLHPVLSLAAGLPAGGLFGLTGPAVCVGNVEQLSRTRTAKLLAYHLLVSLLAQPYTRV